ncbi:GNAT family N-acetyltransferase [Agromyces seonyuensis]|uniref:GNAT family N-acetyltransferase n=1 Tax=Agromyces seonyuensis TaxID=2662446 RepID=A0A6I4NUZ8_9MICO|nr:GNAT family N-acetyltransferase [Agromyces seonyuensis]MWB98063.1 GNAT family N-acetyltransferase [Agromyces seonyuensis]
MAGFHVRRTTADDWRQVRALRLEMLEDTPLAFLETMEHALAQPEAEWRNRGARGSHPGRIALAAIESDPVSPNGEGRWIGTMGGFVPDAKTGPMLIGVYVSPDYRGSRAGVADALLDGIEEWARMQATTLTLEVHERNPRATRFYERRGFHDTGARTPYPLVAGDLEVVMVKRL